MKNATLTDVAYILYIYLVCWAEFKKSMYDSSRLFWLSGIFHCNIIWGRFILKVGAWFCKPFVIHLLFLLWTPHRSLSRPPTFFNYLSFPHTWRLSSSTGEYAGTGNWDTMHSIVWCSWPLSMEPSLSIDKCASNTCPSTWNVSSHSSRGKSTEIEKGYT